MREGVTVGTDGEDGLAVDEEEGVVVAEVAMEGQVVIIEVVFLVDGVDLVLQLLDLLGEPTVLLVGVLLGLLVVVSDVFLVDVDFQVVFLPAARLLVHSKLYIMIKLLVIYS